VNWSAAPPLSESGFQTCDSKTRQGYKHVRGSKILFAWALKLSSLWSHFTPCQLCLPRVLTDSQPTILLLLYGQAAKDFPLQGKCVGKACEPSVGRGLVLSLV
jgi:hypothetical protein